MTTALLLAALLAYDPVMCADGGGTPSLPAGVCVGDLSLPARVTDETPAVLVIHGGGWTSMNRHGMDGIADFLREDMGCVVYNIEYWLASAKNPWPACGDDCVKAANFMFSDAFAKAAGMRPKDFRGPSPRNLGTVPTGLRGLSPRNYTKLSPRNYDENQIN